MKSVVTVTVRVPAPYFCMAACQRALTSSFSMAVRGQGMRDQYDESNNLSGSEKVGDTSKSDAFSSPARHSSRVRSDSK